MSDENLGTTPVQAVCCSPLLLKKITAVLHTLPYEKVAPLMNEIHKGFRPITYAEPIAPKE